MRRVTRLIAGLCMFCGATAHSQSQPSTKSLPHFEVSTIKPSKDLYLPGQISSHPERGDIRMKANTVAGILYYIFDLHSKELLELEPRWAFTEYYDLEAKVSEDGIAKYQRLTDAERRAVLRELIEKRFGLKFHYESREIPVFKLTIAKGGIKMKEVKPGDPESIKWPGGAHFADGRMDLIRGINYPMDDLILSLSAISGRQVVNLSGLTGSYDFELHWDRSPDGGRNTDTDESASSASPATQEPTLFTAIQEQLGLKLKPGSARMQALVVDHIERPSSD